MAFSNEWEAVYQAKQQLVFWPWTDVVAYVSRYVQPKPHCKILELGFGTGVNIPFFEKIHADFYGIDGSASIVEAAKKQFPAYSKNLICADFTTDIPFNEEFDVVVDRASITCNSTADIMKTIKLIYDKLKRGGFFIGIDWFSTKHSECKRDGIIVDDHSKILNEGYFKGRGIKHFSDQKHLRELLSMFKIRKLEEKVHTDYTEADERMPCDNNIEVIAAWNFAAQKE